MRLMYLPLLAFTLMLSSCLTEERITLIPEEEEITVETETNDENFTIGGSAVQLDFGYVHSVPIPESPGFRHHIVLTRTDVREGNNLTGVSDALTFIVDSPDEDLTGTYVSFAETGERVIRSSSFYNDLVASDNNNYPQQIFSSGEITITASDEGYDLFIDFPDDWSFNRLTGHFAGTLQTVEPVTLVIPSPEDFAGDNGLIIGDAETPLTNAYLVKKYEGSNGETVYQMVIAERELSAGEALSGVSSALMYDYRGAPNAMTGRYNEGSYGNDFLSSGQQRSLNSPFYCTNYDFVASTFDDDESTQGETLIYRDGEEFMFRFTGVTNRNGDIIEGIYRGPLTIID